MHKPKRPTGLSEKKGRYRYEAGGARPDHPAPQVPPPEALPNGTVRYFLKVGAKGRVLLPAEMRAAMGLEEGNLITAWLKEAEVHMYSHLHGLRKIQDEAASMARGTGYASDELIAERRAEAAKEAEEALISLREHRKRNRR